VVGLDRHRRRGAPRELVGHQLELSGARARHHDQRVTHQIGRLAAELLPLRGRRRLEPGLELGDLIAQRGIRRLLPDLPPTLTADALVDAFPQLWASVTMQGSALVLERRPGSARLAVRAQVEPSLELSGFVAGLVRAAIRNTGVPSSEVMLTSCQALGDALDVYGVPWR
jgi:hypothetical protein